MVILIRCNDIVSDPRVMKYVGYLRENKIDHFIIGWDRERNSIPQDDIVYYNTKAGYNVGGFKAAWNRVRWMYFIIRSLLPYRHANHLVLHACDLDAAYPAAIFKKIFNSSVKVVFDVFDWYSATLYNQNGVILRAFKYMEKVAVKYSDKIIICEPERIEQIPYRIEENKISILPNIPHFTHKDFLCKDEKFKFNNSLITFAYVGGFSTERCITEIITLAKEGAVNLLIAGFGNADIEGMLQDLSDCPFIKYFGKVKYTDGLNIMYNADVVYAMYAKSNPNHIYAAPNKYYEAMFLGKPIFTTKGTIVERKVDCNGLGYTSEESIEDIKKVIDCIDRTSLNQYGSNAANLWSQKYCSYTQDFLSGQYYEMINQ